MARVLVVPDAHLKIDTIKKGVELADLYMASHIILLGDYFDDWDAPPEKYYEMMDYLKNLMARNANVFPLMGNHELSYLGYPCSGYNAAVADYMKSKLENDRRFISCMSLDGVLYSHAGVTEGWLRHNAIATENDIRYTCLTSGGAAVLEDKISRREWDKISIFAQVAKERGGKDPHGSCMWADLQELVSDAVGSVKQVVGHTPVKSIQHLGNLWFCDTQSNDNVCDEYLFVNEGEPTVINYETRNEDNRRIKKWQK